MPDVSIIIPNLHSPVVGHTLESLQDQTSAGSREIVVVGQDRYGLVREQAGLRHIITPQPVSPAKARNIGIRATTGDILVFIDADCVAAPDWLEHLLAPYASPATAVVGGSVIFPEVDYLTLCDNVAIFHDYLPTNPRGFLKLMPTINLSVRRTAVEAVGMFDENYPYLACEDANFTTRLRLHGYRLQFEPEAKVWHLPPDRRRLRPLLTKSYVFGRNSIKVDRRYQDVHRVPVVLRHWWLTGLLAPLLAAGVLTRIVIGNRSGLRYWKTFPIVYMLKIAWCLGAARSLRYGIDFGTAAPPAAKPQP